MTAPHDYTYLIPGRLAQGSAPPPGAQLPFDVIVLAAREYQPALPGYEVIYVPLSDDGPPPTYEERELIRDQSSRIARRLRAGRRVLVTCRQGRNRSGVLAGRALVELGHDPERVFRTIRQLRNGLTNTYFADMVLRHKAVS